jgi:seryl-tRNA synthetase
MAILDQIGQEKQRISERLMRVDAERTKLTDQLDELETAERALSRLGGKALVTEKRRRGRAASAASPAGKGRKKRGGKRAPDLSLRDATLKAVQAHANGASASEVLNYLSREFGLTVRPNR